MANQYLHRLSRGELYVTAFCCAAVMSVIGCQDAEQKAPSDSDASIGPAADGGAGLERDGAADAALADAAIDAAVGVRFEIGVSTSSCTGECPLYDIQLDQTGNVMFNGRGYTRQQGWGGRTVSQETAAELMELIVAADYWSLQDIYRETSDGCREVEPDRSTYTWNVTTDGPAKIVVDYQGCKGVRELEALRKVPALLIEKLGLANYLGR
jgi:hypothetical protein